MTGIDLITGFLGAGKTTFITEYAAFCRRQGERVAVVENEFGEAGVDAGILCDAGVDVEQLAGGCICCTQKVGFHDVLVRLAGEYDRLLVEPSGIFDIDDFWEVVRSPAVRKAARVESVICIADPQLLSSLEGDAETVMARQLAGASAVVMSKTQCLSADAAEAVPDLLRRYCSGLEEDRICMKPWDAWTDGDFARIRRLSLPENDRPRIRMDHSTLFMSTTLEVRVRDADTLRHALGRLMAGECGRILRIKGRVSLATGACLWVNCTAREISLSPAEDGDARLNIIGQGLRRKILRRILESEA